MNESYICYDILFHIFEYLDVNNINNVRLVSKLFDDVLNDDLLWKIYYMKNYNIKHKDLHVLSNENAYKKCHEIDVFSKLYDNKFIKNKSIIDIINLQGLNLSQRMTKIRSSHLIDNKIREIPNIVTQLINLQKIYFDRNEIIEIPQSIARLVNLQYFSLNYNKIKEIPKEIGLLFNLQGLDLSGNQIKRNST